MSSSLLNTLPFLQRLRISLESDNGLVSLLLNLG